MAVVMEQKSVFDKDKDAILDVEITPNTPFSEFFFHATFFLGHHAIFRYAGWWRRLRPQKLTTAR